MTVDQHYFSTWEECFNKKTKKDYLNLKEKNKEWANVRLYPNKTWKCVNLYHFNSIYIIIMNNARWNLYTKYIHLQQTENKNEESLK